MRQPAVQVDIDGVGPAVCYPGSLIGRLSSARIRLQHPDISEAHALISLRQGALWLLFLRRPLTTDEGPRWEMELTEGLVVHLARGVRLRVTRLWPADEAIALRVDDRPPRLMDGSPIALDADGRWVAQSDVVRVWFCEGEPWLRVGDAPPAPILPGGCWRFGAHTLRAEVVAGGTSWTHRTERRPRTHVLATRTHAEARDELGVNGRLSGSAAVVIYAIARWQAEHGTAAPWTTVAVALWGADGHTRRDSLRENVLYRLDQRLRRLGLRDDLVLRADGMLWFGEGVDVELLG